MFTRMAQAQDDVVNAVLDQIEDDPGWRHAFLRAEFSVATERAGPLTDAFLVSNSRNADTPRFYALDPAVIDALRSLHLCYAENGHPFERLDLTIAAPDGRYRFAFDRGPALAERREIDAYLLARYADLIGED